MRKHHIKNITHIALFVAAICVLAQIAIQIPPIPITLQTLAIAFCGYHLGLKKSAIAVFVYLLLGVAGVPVFAGFKGGFYVLLSYTGGFLWGFIPYVIMCSIGKKQSTKILCGIAGVLVCHLLGVVQYAIVARVSIWLSLMVASLPYLLKDIALTIFAFFIAKRVNKIIM